MYETAEGESPTLPDGDNDDNKNHNDNKFNDKDKDKDKDKDNDKDDNDDDDDDDDDDGGAAATAAAAMSVEMGSTTILFYAAICVQIRRHRTIALGKARRSKGNTKPDDQGVGAQGPGISWFILRRRRHNSRRKSCGLGQQPLCVTSAASLHGRGRLPIPKPVLMTARRKHLPR